jgi:hypothetical protein
LNKKTLSKYSGMRYTHPYQSCLWYKHYNSLRYEVFYLLWVQLYGRVFRNKSCITTPSVGKSPSRPQGKHLWFYIIVLVPVPELIFSLALPKFWQCNYGVAMSFITLLFYYWTLTSNFNRHIYVASSFFCISISH